MSERDVSEGLPVGEVGKSQGRTIGEGEFAMLTDLTWTTGELHSNREYMRDTEFGERLLGGPIVGSIVASLSALSRLNRRMHDDYGVRTVAALALDADYRHPVYPGDTLSTEMEVVSARPSSSRQGQGVLVVKDRGFNQHGDLVIEMTRTVLFERDWTVFDAGQSSEVSA